MIARVHDMRTGCTHYVGPCPLENAAEARAVLDLHHALDRALVRELEARKRARGRRVFYVGRIAPRPPCELCNGPSLCILEGMPVCLECYPAVTPGALSFQAPAYA